MKLFSWGGEAGREVRGELIRVLRPWVHTTHFLCSGWWWKVGTDCEQ